MVLFLVFFSKSKSFLRLQSTIFCLRFCCLRCYIWGLAKVCAAADAELRGFGLAVGLAYAACRGVREPRRMWRRRLGETEVIRKQESRWHFSLDACQVEGGPVYRSTLCRTRGARRGPKKVDFGTPMASSEFSRQELSIAPLAVSIGRDLIPQLGSWALSVLVCYSHLTQTASVWKIWGAPGGGRGGGQTFGKPATWTLKN